MDRDPGFDRSMFAGQLDQISRLGSRRVAEYGVTGADFERIKERLTGWSGEILVEGREPAAGHSVDRSRAESVSPELAQVMKLVRLSYPVSAQEAVRRAPGQSGQASERNPEREKGQGLSP